MIQQKNNGRYNKAQIYYESQTSNISSSSAEEYKTPDCSFVENEQCSINFNSGYVGDIRKPCSCNVIEKRVTSMSIITEMSNKSFNKNVLKMERNSFNDLKSNEKHIAGVIRSKSDFEIPKKVEISKPESFFQNFSQKSDALFSFLTPRAKRKHQNSDFAVIKNQSTPTHFNSQNNHIKILSSPIFKYSQHSLPGTRTTSPILLKSTLGAKEDQLLDQQQIQR